MKWGKGDKRDMDMIKNVKIKKIRIRKLEIKEEGLHLHC